MVRRYFHKYMNEKHYNRKWGKEMAGISLDGVRSEWTRGEIVVTNQEIINSLQVAISKLDQIIADMSANCECNKA
jgi:hypothetical protein